MSGDWAALGIDTRGATTGTVRTTCPQCSPTRHKTHERCLAVNLDDGVYCCHHCGYAGKLPAATNGYGTPERDPAPRNFRRPEPTAAGETLSLAARQWLYDRGLTDDVLTRYGITSRVTTMPQVDGKVQAICFPYRRGGALVNVKYRDREKHFRMEPGAELILYGLDDIAAGQPLAIVEGEIDKLSLAVAGWTACVSVPNGAPPAGARNMARHFAFLDSAADALDAASEYLIAVDNDAPGLALRDELVRRLGAERCRLVSWPDSCKDANDVLRQHGPDAITAALVAAPLVPVSGIFHVADLSDRIDALYAEGLPGGVHPGSEALARHYRVRPGQWTLVSGIPSHGKSTWLDWLLVNLARRHGWRFAVCSPENQPLERHAAKLLQIYAGQPFGQGPHPRMDAATKDEAKAWLDEYGAFILPDTSQSYALDAILALARVEVRRRGIKALVIDPWNELEHSRPAGMREDEHISTSLTKMRRFAREHDLHIWLVAHPRQLVKGADGIYPPPSPYDIAGGAQFRNKADMFVTVYRDVNDDRAPVQVLIQKVRFQGVDGEPGTVELWYDKVSGRYFDYGPILHQEAADDWHAGASEPQDERDPWDDIQPAD